MTTQQQREKKRETTTTTMMTTRTTKIGIGNKTLKKTYYPQSPFCDRTVADLDADNISQLSFVCSFSVSLSLHC